MQLTTPMTMSQRLARHEPYYFNTFYIPQNCGTYRIKRHFLVMCCQWDM